MDVLDCMCILRRGVRKEDTGRSVGSAAKGGVMMMRAPSVTSSVVGGGVRVLCGDVAQMVERSLSMREVQGWIPCFCRRV